ncbi:Nin1 binding protein [Apophysomyces ossiformis]|uniref:20S-pre-rRNA D-site endonuclease NOB1 n=1 Tax=Apophysomyces ossiformis TaxID=679940 RepID=A0A8H7BSN5_9FUNG|nr:Nin1 binding protein [Apophysomyces ossiformis]
MSNEQKLTQVDPNKSKLGWLVIDTNAIIHGMSLKDLAEDFYTCPEVITEVRSAHSRDFLSRLPFEIRIENPSEESLRAVVEFSKKTGDYASLSIPDLKVLALTHMLEVRKNGTENIRKEPANPRPTALPTAPPPAPRRRAVQAPEVDEDGWEIVPVKGKAHKQNNKQKINDKPATKPNDVEEQTPTVKEQQEEQKQEDHEEKSLNEASSTPENETAVIAEKNEASIETVTDSLAETTMEDEEEEDDSDAGEWITPDNLEEFRAKELGVTPEELRRTNKVDVACMTNDFAMQNVLLQMNLNLVSSGGYRITKIKNWVLRCHACYTVTSNMEKKFCPKCGNASLRRVSCSTNSKGEIRYHLKRNFTHNLRGTKYDVPIPKGGRHANNIVLREDQKEYIKAQQSRSKQKVIDMFDPDFIPMYRKADTRTINNNMFGTSTIGFGRRNPNEVRRKSNKNKRK